MIPCPVCQKPVDPLRARHVRVLDGRVTAYCSAECAGQGAAKAAAPAPAVGVVAPVESGKVKKAGEPADKSVPPKAEPAADKKPAASEDLAKAGAAEAKASAGKSAAPSKPAESKPTEAKATEAKAAEAKAAEAKAAEAKAAEAKAAEAKAAEAKAAAKDKGAPKDAAKSKDAKGKDAGKVASPPTSAAPAKDAAAASPGASASAKKSAPSGEAAKPEAPTASAAEPVAAKGSRKGLWIAAAAVALAIAGGALWAATRPEATPPPPPPAPPPPAPTPPPPPVFTRAEALDRASTVLREHLTIESLRVRRVAAAALGRQRDPGAIETLAALLPTEQSEIAKLDIGYGLARAKDPRGFEILLAGLQSSRRDVKGEAARLLASLKDQRAATVLSSLANLSQFRMSATEQLARLGNQPAIARLAKLREDPAASEEDRWRAAIALGDAGQPQVAESLRGLLADSRFNVKAAGALATLRDDSCRSVLLDHLATPTLRVEAALALRRLDPELDPAALLPILMPHLSSAKDTERVEAAEAVLLLTGPAELAEHD